MFFKAKANAFDFLIAGLGNPGMEYEKTRHNAGFCAIEKLAEDTGCSFTKHKFEAEFGDTLIGDSRVILMKPLTYMNNSGRALKAVSAFYKIPSDKIIVLFDDISLDIGKIRIRRKGSAGGHNGIKDITELMGTEDIMRIKIGVGERPTHEYDLKDWVLGKIPAENADDFKMALENAAKAAETIVTSGIDTAMNKYSK